MPRWQIEQGGHAGLFPFAAHQTRIGTLAQRQPECIKKNGFARTGFTGHGRHAGIEFNLGLIDDGKIAYV